MNKVLTISVAAYNVEKFLNKSIGSLIESNVIDKLEVFIVDDGGKDQSLNIAKYYESLYPDSIHAVHKANGGYGSTVNYSLEHATGKYFKLLDGDDWFDSKGLRDMVEELEKIDVDIYVTPFYRCLSSKEMVKESFDKVKNHKCLGLGDIGKDTIISMWAMTYKTSVLKKAKLKLPEHMLYTDQYFATIPLAYSDTVYFSEVAVYCYRLGRDGQSVSKESRIKHLEDTKKICLDLIEFCRQLAEEKNRNYEYISYRVAGVCCRGLKTVLLKPVNEDNRQELIELDKKILNGSQDVYMKMMLMGKSGRLVKWLRRTAYLLYWGLKLLPNGLPNWG